uniref:NS1 n=1 Tax=uncultured densovirus TaxID=748192 RepID=A0A7L7YUG3_9VIRU|nr:NS1 [uncultured densovirus]
MSSEDDDCSTSSIRGDICTFSKLGALREGKSRMASEIHRVCGESGGDSGDTGSIQYSGSTTGNSTSMVREYSQSCKLQAEQTYKVLQRGAGTYLSDVIPCGDSRKALYLCRELQRLAGLSFTRNLLIISHHNEHVHIVHDCSFATGACRCSFIKKAENLFGLRRGRRSKRRRPLSNELEISDLQDIFTYFDEEGRRIYHFRIGRRVETIPIQHKDLEVGGSQERGTKRPLEACEEMDDAELRREEFQNYDGIGRNRRGIEAIHEKKQKKYTQTNQEILSMCKNIPMCPIEGILNHPAWLKNDRLQFLNMENKNVKNVMNNWTKQLCTWTIHDFNALYDDPLCDPIFSAGYGQKENYYYSVDRSLQVLIEFLEFQFHNEQEDIMCFLTDLFDILERRRPKLNSLLVKGPPSSGKNYFFDCIKDYYLNVGHLCRANRYNNFAFQDADGRRLILWNEPNYSEEYVEVLKELLGGDSTNVSVKYRAEAPIYRTPVILLTNRQLSIMNHIAFKDRLSIYHWMQAEYLKELNKKPNPLCTYKLFEHYGLIKPILYISFIILI